MVDSWLVAHALPPGIATTLHHVDENDEDEELCQLAQNDTANAAATSADQLQASGQNAVPNRAISAPVCASAGSKNRYDSLPTEIMCPKLIQSTHFSVPVREHRCGKSQRMNSSEGD